MENGKKVTLDDSDLRLLDLLQHDATLSNQALAEQASLSPATCHRRVRRLWNEGFIQSQVAILAPQKMADATGAGLTALLEVTLDVQTHDALDFFEKQAVKEDAVQQCWRVSPGPDFVLVAHVADMPAYHELAQRLFTQGNQVRNVRAFFAVKRAKFGTRVPIWPGRAAGGTG